ncbi:MAG TPA: Ig-like domain repeat protein, partial [Thermoanaerobaculia bacterium]
GGSWIEQAYLQPTGRASSDHFGRSVAIDGDTAIVGTFGDDTSAGTNAGKAYVFVRSGTAWEQQAQLESDDPSELALFGSIVALSGDTALVLASRKDQFPSSYSRGSAYIFVRNGTTWTQQAKLEPIGLDQGESFAISGDIDGDTVVIGALTDDAAETPEVGSAFVFTRSGSTWTQQARLETPHPYPFGSFGVSVAIDGNTIVVGAPGDDWRVPNAGAAYVFVRTAGVWTLQGELFANDAVAGDRIGMSVAVDGDIVILGAPYNDTAAGDLSGSAYVFVRNGTTWMQQFQLHASDGAMDDAFGFSVRLDGNFAIVGAPAHDSPGGFDSGAAYVFRRDGVAWSQQAQIVAPDGGPRDSFGYSVTLRDGTAIVGAPDDDSPTDYDSGSAYVFLLQPRGVTVTPSAGLVTTEAGGTATFTMALESQPASDVTIALSSSDPTEGSVTPSSVTFTSANYSIPQSVTISGVDDSVVDGSIVYTIITAPATSNDSVYNGFNAANVSVTNTDNDSNTVVTSTNNPSTIGETVTFKATVTAAGATPSGSVTFLDGATPLATVSLSAGVATHTTNALTAGNHTITATYGGSATHTTSSGIVVQTVNEPPNPAPQGANFHLVTPCRIYDSRSQGGALSATSAREIIASGVCGIPAGTRAIAANLTVVSPAESGWMAAYAAGSAWPGVSTTSYRVAKTRANNTLISLSDGAFEVKNG